MRWITILSSAVITAVVVAAYLQEGVLSDWRALQAHYKKLLVQEAANDSERAMASDYAIKLRQDYLPELGRVDRCVSCHVGIEDPRMKTEAQPLSTHPGNYLETHDVDRFGCTICHDGQGRATIWRDAQGRDEDLHFEHPMLAEPFIQARCYRCHIKELEETPVYNEGRHLFATSGCSGCHKVKGRGGALGPSLDGISDAVARIKHATVQHEAELLAKSGGNRNIAYIMEAVKYPQAQPTNSMMFDFHFNDKQVLALAVYLKSFEKEEISARGYIPTEKNPLPADRNARGKLIFQRFCTACHGPRGAGGRPNPNAIAHTIPALNALNERLRLFSRDDANKLFAGLEQSHGVFPDDIDIDQARVVKAMWGSIWSVVHKGNPSGKVDPKGPQPINMPSWGGVLTDDELVSVLSYLVSQGEFDDDGP